MVHTGFGVLLAIPLAAAGRSRWRWLVHIATATAVFANVAAFHYEAVFGRLPGAAVFHYVSEARHLASSASANAPIAAVAAEIIVVTFILVFAAERLGARVSSPAPVIKVAAVVSITCVIATIILHAAPALVPSRHAWAARVPIVWIIQTWQLQRSSHPAGTPAALVDLVRGWQRQLGHRDAFGGADPRYPLCGAAPRPSAQQPNGRNVIYLVLESVGIAQLNLRHQNQVVMPNLQRIARENILFENMKATGSKSLHALPALYAGLPPQPALNLLWREPLNQMEGFARLLQEQSGYRTAYFDGGDLSFEQQRQFATMMGFDEIIEFDLAAGLPFLGWGWPDDITFGKMREWIDDHREKRPSRPYLATLLNLSSHDPYILPPGRKRVFAGEGRQADFIESLRFLDEQLGPLYDWYLEHEKPRGTLLIIVGDHTPHISPEGRLAEGDLARFDVPFILAGQHLPRADPDRLAAHFDVPATIHGLLQTSAGACDQGVDLFLPPDAWPRERVVYSVDGDQLEEFNVWFPEGRVHLNLASGVSRVYVASETARESLTERALEFYRTTRTISAELSSRDAFAPPREDERASAPRPVAPVEQPAFIRQPALRRPAIEAAVAAGAEWIEVGVQLTRDAAAVVLHEPIAADAEVYGLSLQDLRTKPGYADVMTLDEVFRSAGEKTGLLIVVHPQKTFYRNSVLALQSASIARRFARPGKIIMTSSSSFVADSLDQHCECPVGMDAPPRGAVQQSFLEHASITGMEWIRVRGEQATAELIRMAHAAGLKVVVHDVADQRNIERFASEWPDAISSPAAP